MNFGCNLGFSLSFFWYSVLIPDHQSGTKGGKGSTLSSCLTAICCSLNNVWAFSRRSTILCTYSLCTCWSPGGGLFINKSGNRNSLPNINMLAVSPVLACGVPRKARSSWSSTRFQSPCSLSRKRALSASPSTLLPLSTTLLDWG